MVQTVIEKYNGYSQRQLINAKKARDLYTNFGYPSIREFIVMIKKNMINNCLVTIEVLIRAGNIKGPSVQALKRKTICKKLSPVVTDYVAIPHAIFEEIEMSH